MESISFRVINNSLTSLIAQLVLTIQIRLVKNFPKLEKKTNKKTESVQEEDKVELQLVFCLKTPKNKATKSLMIYFRQNSTNENKMRLFPFKPFF